MPELEAIETLRLSDVKTLGLSGNLADEKVDTPVQITVVKAAVLFCDRFASGDRLVFSAQVDPAKLDNPLGTRPSRCRWCADPGAADL